MPAWGFPDTVKATDLAEMMGKERKDINQALKLLKESGKTKSPQTRLLCSRFTPLSNNVCDDIPLAIAPVPFFLT